MDLEFFKMHFIKCKFLKMCPSEAIKIVPFDVSAFYVKWNPSDDVCYSVMSL